MSTPTIPAQIQCARCGQHLGSCTARALVLSGSMIAIVSKTRVRCQCGWVRAWVPEKIDSEVLTQTALVS